MDREDIRLGIRNIKNLPTLPVIVSRILDGFSRRITPIPQAVVVLGFDTVRSLALSVSVFAALSNKSGDISFDWEAFWIHSIGWHIAVVDTGIGIKKEHQELIFSEFRQVEET